MVQQLFNTVELLKDEVRRLKGELHAISVGGRIIPNVITSGVQLPLPISGAILYGTGVPEWARLAPGTNGEILTLVSGFPSWEPNAAAGDIETFPTSELDDTLVLAPDGLGGVEWVTVPAGTPSATVEDETTFGISPDAGVSNDYSRGDHTHGTPADPGSFGAWSSEAFNAANFTASAGNWTLTSPDQVHYDYIIAGKLMLINFFFNATTVSSTPASLSVVLPNGETCAKQVDFPVSTYDNGVLRNGYCRISAGATTMTFFRDILASGNWAAATNNTGIAGFIAIEIQ